MFPTVQTANHRSSLKNVLAISTSLVRMFCRIQASADPGVIGNHYLSHKYGWNSSIRTAPSCIKLHERVHADEYLAQRSSATTCQNKSPLQQN